MVCYSHLFQNFPQFIVIHTVKGFGIVNKAEIDVFMKLSCFFDDPADVGNLICGSPAFPKTRLNIWKFMIHILLKPGLENFEHYFASVWDECNCVVVRIFFGIAFLWDWNENWPFPVLWPLRSFLNLLAYWCWERLRAGGEGDDRGWDGWMASPTQWTWVWVNSGNWWWTGRPGMLQFTGLQRVGHDWATELNWM